MDEPGSVQGVYGVDGIAGSFDLSANVLDRPDEERPKALLRPRGALALARQRDGALVVAWQVPFAFELYAGLDKTFALERCNAGQNARPIVRLEALDPRLALRE
ncbi:MAG: hypothetical protein ABSG95_09410 [Solirubrobacteraceae bacterium]